MFPCIRTDEYRAHFKTSHIQRISKLFHICSGWENAFGVNLEYGKVMPFGYCIHLQYAIMPKERHRSYINKSFIISSSFGGRESGGGCGGAEKATKSIVFQLHEPVELFATNPKLPSFQINLL